MKPRRSTHHLFQLSSIIFLSLICGIFATASVAECKVIECTDNTNDVYAGSMLSLVEKMPQAVIDRCVVRDRKPLRLRPSHIMYEKIRQLKPDTSKNNEKLQIVLNENAETCEITTVVLVDK